ETTTYTERVDGKIVSVTTETRPPKSTSDSSTTSPVIDRPLFVPARNPTNSSQNWEGIKARTPKIAMPPIDYEDLNSSYDSRVLETSEEDLVVQPSDTSASTSSRVDELEKEMFSLRIKAMDLVACQHKIDNFTSLLRQ